MSKEMRLSEAIRLGAMLKPKGIGPQSAAPWNEATCAWGAAAQAGNCQIVESTIEDDDCPLRGHPGGKVRHSLQVPQTWLVIAKLHSDCPECGRADSVDRLMAHLNDDHDLVRERTADWVAELENAQEARQAEAASHV